MGDGLKGTVTGLGGSDGVGLPKKNLLALWHPNRFSYTDPGIFFTKIGHKVTPGDVFQNFSK